MQQELFLIKQQLRYLKIYAITSSALLVFVFLAAFNAPGKKFDIIRARGIVIEDKAGHDRILIGSPVPFSKDRVRTDTNLVRKYWAKEFGGDIFMKAYATYHNSTEGIIFLNENGFDKVAIGDKLVDPNTGKRQFTSTGLLWNDDEGFERGGIGVNKTTDGKYRSVLGLDDASGEAVHLFTLEDGTKALRIADDEGFLLIGTSRANGEWFKNKNSFTGIKYFNSKGEQVWEQAMKRP